MIKQFQISLIALRISLGGLFLWSGLSKAFSGFTATGFLLKATGPLGSLYQSMAGSMVVDFLVVFGEIGIGLALILGMLTRFASLCGMLMMFTFYLATLPQARGPMNDQMIYFLVFFHLFSSGAGQYWGLDRALKHLPWYEKQAVFRKLIG